MRVKVNILKSLKNLYQEAILLTTCSRKCTFKFLTFWNLKKSLFKTCNNCPFTIVLHLSEIKGLFFQFNRFILLKYISIDWFWKTINWFSLNIKDFYKKLFFKNDFYLIQMSFCILLSWCKRANNTHFLRLKSYPN